MAGYHLAEIKKGKLGTVSKIQEELDEAIDSINQGVKIMLLVELSDLIGAVKMVATNCGENLESLLPTSIPFVSKSASLTQLQKLITLAQTQETNKDRLALLDTLKQIVVETANLALHFNSSLEDLMKMQAVTERAFVSGSRK